MVAVGGTNGKTVVAQLVASLLRLSDKRVALSCSDGLYFDQRRIGQWRWLRLGSRAQMPDQPQHRSRGDRERQPPYLAKVQFTTAARWRC